MKVRALSLFAIAALSGCSNQAPQDNDQSTNAQIASLKSENARLKAENAELRQTPFALLAAVTSHVQARKISDAELALSTLRKKFPGSSEEQSAAKLIDQLKRNEAEKTAEAARLAALASKD